MSCMKRLLGVLLLFYVCESQAVIIENMSDIFSLVAEVANNVTNTTNLLDRWCGNSSHMECIMVTAAFGGSGALLCFAGTLGWSVCVLGTIHIISPLIKHVRDDLYTTDQEDERACKQKKALRRRKIVSDQNKRLAQYHEDILLGRKKLSAQCGAINPNRRCELYSGDIKIFCVGKVVQNQKDYNVD